jgi:hypothetical protein
MASESPSPSDSIGKAQSIVQHVLNRQVQIQAAKVGVFAAGSAATIRDIGDVLQKRRPSKAASDFTTYLAGRTDALATYLQQTDGSAMLDDLQRYGGTQPVVASLIALTSGFAAARILKVSSIRARLAG